MNFQPILHIARSMRMPFQSCHTQIQTIQIKRKEMTLTHYINKLIIFQIEKVSAWTERASVTVEAALALPLFFFAALLLTYQLEMAAIETQVEAGANSAAKVAAKEMYVLPVLNPMQMESDIVNVIGDERLDRSIIDGGSSGLNCSGSYANPQSGVIHVKVSYRLKMPFPKFAVPPMTVKKEFKIKGWTGYEKEGIGESAELVYITDHAAVYHKDYHCTHLQLSVHMVSTAEVGDLRNEGGGKYHACEFCGHGSTSGGVYITNEGNRYHTRANCSGLKRTIYAVQLSQVKGKGACSRCGQ